MIIWIRERKGWVAVLFVVMIVIFGASFVIGGVGTGNQASLSDIFGNSGGSSGGTTTPTAGSVGSLEKKVKAQPKNAQAWTDLANAYASATQPSDEARAWAKVNALKPGNMATLQRLALAQAQVATNNSSQAQQLQQAGLQPVAGQRQHLLGRHARHALRGSGHAGTGRGRCRPAVEVPDPGEHLRQEGEHLVEALDGHLRQDRRAPVLLEERPRRDDLAQLRLGRAERERHEDGDQGL